MSSVDLKLEKFVRRVTHTNTGYTRLCLIQVMTGGSFNVLRDVQLDLSETIYDSEKVAEIVAEMTATAQEDADGHSGLTTYCLQALKGVTRGERSPLFRLRSQESEMGIEALGETEPATKDGHLAQLMRHTEGLMRLLVQQQEVSSRQSTDIISRLVDQNKHYEERHWETMVRAEELADEREERETKRMQLVNRENRMDEALKTFKPLVPVLVSKLKGIPVDAKAAMQISALKSVLGDINTDQMEQIVKVLGPKSIALGELWLEMQKETSQEPRH
jgi:hypothetical protein